MLNPDAWERDAMSEVKGTPSKARATAAGTTKMKTRVSLPRPSEMKLKSKHLFKDHKQMSQQMMKQHQQQKEAATPAEIEGSSDGGQGAIKALLDYLKLRVLFNVI